MRLGFGLVGVVRSGNLISFELSEEQQLIRAAVAQFAQNQLQPKQRQLEASAELDAGVRQAAAAMGLGTMAMAESYGGQGLGMQSCVLVAEEIAKADAAAAFALPGPGLFGLAMQELGTKEQCERWLAPLCDNAASSYGAVAWSERRPLKERPGFATTAQKQGEGYRLCGEKVFVGCAELARSFVVFAQVEPDAGWDGIGAFVVEADAPGVKLGSRHRTLGLQGASFGEVSFDVALEPAARLQGSGVFAESLLCFFSKQALLVAARAVGLAESAFQLARGYCQERSAFGKPIAHFQAVAFRLADRHMDVQAARWALWRAAWQWDSDGSAQKASLLLTAQAAAQALESAMRCADDCVSLHGGMGFIRDALAEKYMRDAKQLASCCSTVDQLDQLAAHLELGLPLDAALLLPTPESQAIFT